MFDIFCPTCHELILDADVCPGCAWRRPVFEGAVSQVTWTADLGVRLNKPHCYPVVAGNYYCLGAEDGDLLALDIATGEVAWEHALPPGTMAHALTAAAECVWVGMEDVRSLPQPGKEVLALDARTGAVIQRLAFPAHSTSAVAVAGGRAYFTTSNGQLCAVDALTGRICWEAEHPAWSPSAPGVDAEIVCAGGRSGTLVAYTVAEGQELWRFTAAGAARWFSAPLLLAQKRVFALAWDDHLYVLDAHTGALLWKFRGERGRGITAPVALHDTLVYVGSRVQPKGYALLALDAITGAERWRLAVEKAVLTPPYVAEGVIFCATGGHDGYFYAIDAATGAEQWRLAAPSQVVTRPCIAGDLVIFGGRDGLLHAARWRMPAQEQLLAPDVYLQAGDFEKAAIAYALNGNLARSAALYANRLARPREAAQLYAQAGLLAESAQLWESLAELRRARALYQQIGDKASLGRILESLGETLSAARMYEELNDLGKAAQLYESAGDRAHAAELYHRLGYDDRAQSIWQSLGDWEKRVNAYQQKQQYAEAAQLLETHGKLERAVELYTQAQQWEQALALRIHLGHWEQVAGLAKMLQHYLKAADAYERMGQFESAVEMYIEGGKQLRAAKDSDEQAALAYECAARLYGEPEYGVYDEQRESACRRMVRQLRRQPEIEITLAAEEAFIEYQHNTLTLQLTNRGTGIAREINVQLNGKFDVEGERAIPVLPPGKERRMELFVRPHRDHYGPKVPLEISVTYTDQQRKPYTLTQRLSVPVNQAGILSGLGGGATPINIHIDDYIASGGRKISGDAIYGHKGDRVEVNRSGKQTQLPEAGPEGVRVVMRRGGESARRCPVCNLPTNDPEQRFCSDCGAPLTEGTGRASAEAAL